MESVMSVRHAVELFGSWPVRQRLRAGVWQRPCRGVVVTHNGVLTVHERDLVALASSPPRAALAGSSALRQDGFDARDPRPVVVLPAGARAPSWDRATAHWSHELTDVDVHPTHRPRRTRPARSILDTASWSSNERYARWIVISALQAGLVTTRHLREALTRRGRCRHRSVIVSSILDAAGGIQSVPERDFAAIWRATGLPVATRQEAVRGPTGRFYLDVWSERLGFGVEVHGIPHLAIEQWDEDLVRANEIVITGRHGLTFSSYSIRHHPHTVMDQLDRMARAHGWEGALAPELLPRSPSWDPEQRKILRSGARNSTMLRS
ncbi:hypothetical protein [Aeromicrobium sp. 50.2.37]|uniref:hypothetical protein n=1 Tax=Aeromicrobium sp. 50.2.37 TaxID=2969305 RepID=UPI00214FFED6|nr:hypothetical protein [Aeromicrobium sp. 50.2.37]MCR4513127.1 hypothetical protein [Aeromicrobium sp. 50.2.37]